MAKIANIGKICGGLDRGDVAGGGNNLVDVLGAVVDDLTELRTQLIATLTQLDTEGALGGGYVAGFSPAALETEK